MENLEIASVLREFGDLLEIRGSNPFRVRAYRNAVRTINDLIRPLAAEQWVLNLRWQTWAAARAAVFLIHRVGGADGVV